MSGRPNHFLAQMLQQATLALRAKQFDQAKQLASEVLKSNRTDRNAVLILAHALIGQDHADEAITPLERAARRTGDVEIETLLGAALCAASRQADGIAQLRRTTARQPPYLPAFQELAGQLARAGRLDEAITTIEEGLTLAPDNIDLTIDLGRLCIQSNDRARARAALMRARDAAPGRPDILTELGWLLILDGDYGGAAEAYRHALAMRPDDLMSRANLAKCLLEMGERKQGEAALRSVLRGRPQMLGRVAYVLATASHGRFFFQRSAAAKFLERDQS